ncbi:MAG: Ig-like domain-containing protein [Gammaproteobacteria bacterium]|nr:Ig-like domain-containing protein [Gammaproteobacteria bacterium]
MNGLLRKSLYFLLSAVFLVGCGGSGGGGSGSTTPPTPAAKVVTLTVVDAGTNAATTSVSKAKPAKAIAKVTSGGAAVAGEVVTFETASGFLVLDPSSGTALTNANGEATVNVLAGTTKGATTISASITGNITSNVVGLESAGDGSAGGPNKSVSLQLVNPDTNQPITTITPDAPGKLIATVTNTSQTELVTFESTIGELPIKTAATNAQNQASVSILAGDAFGAGKVTATVEGASAEVVFTIGRADVRMGTADGAFVSGQASVASATLSAGGTNTIRVKLVDSAGSVYLQPVSVNFTTTCASLGKATISSPVTTVNGIASSTYLDKGCATTDNVTVSASTGGVSLSATGSFVVLASSAGSIQYVSATPKVIALRGTGGLGRSESSVVIFKVLDKLGNPVNGKSVNFALNTQIGGLSINPTTAQTNSEGIVQTTVTSGSVATPVRVTATTTGDAGATIASVSDELVISTGLPDQNSFSLSAVTLNPYGWDFDGTTVQVTARLADHFNNPVPDGTAVSFRTEGGSIQPSCTTLNGVCTVTWSSQNPRPNVEHSGVAIPVAPGPQLPCAVNPSAVCADGRAGYYGQAYAGRATITAYAIGEEYFPDNNGNGYFDSTYCVNGSTPTAGKCSDGSDAQTEFRSANDLPEAFVDDNEDGIFNVAVAGGQAGGTDEEPVDFDADGVYDLADQKYTGTLCNPSNADKSRCITSGGNTLHVRQGLVLVMADNDAEIRIRDLNGNDLSEIVLDPAPGTSGRPLIASVAFCVHVSDTNNQPIPSGSTMAVATTKGSLNADPGYTMPSTNRNGSRADCTSVKAEGKADTGQLTVTVTAAGLVTRFGIPVRQLSDKPS